jgi:hypothetical protein
MIDLRINKILFISLTLSAVIHVSLLFGLSGIVDLRFLHPALFKVVFMNLEEEPAVTHNSGKVTAHNLLKNFSKKREVRKNGLQESKQDVSQNEDHAEINEDTATVGGNVTRAVSDATKTQEESLKSQARGTETDINKETVSKVPGDEKDKITHIKSPGPSVKREPLQTMKTLKEVFSYDIFWLGIYVGKASLEAVDSKGILRITSQVHSAPVISTFYRVNDYAESLLMDGLPVNFRIKQQEGKYRSDKETVFDTNSKIITFFNYLNGTKGEHTVKDEKVWDVISGFFYLRTQPLDVGKTVYINIFDSNKFYKARIDVLRKEKIKRADNGGIETIVVKPTLESEGLFQRKGDILIWITDDERRIPIRIATKAPIGSVVAELRDFENEK